MTTASHALLDPWPHDGLLLAAHVQERPNDRRGQVRTDNLHHGRDVLLAGLGLRMSKPLPPWLDPDRDKATMTETTLKGYEYWTRIKQATPAWCNEAHVNRIYRGCPDGHHVDHIVPIRSPLVCGLHCPDNLQYLPELQNMAKSNHWWPDCPHECLPLFPELEEAEQYALPLPMHR